MLSVKVQVRTPNIDATRKTLAGMGRTPPPPVIAQMYDEWEFVFGGFIRRRFHDFSRGAGNWPPLKLASLGGRPKPARRSIRSQILEELNDPRSSVAINRSGRLVQARKHALLKETGQLFNALPIKRGVAPGRGNLKRYVPYGVRVGIGGSARHAAIKRAVATVARGTKAGDANRQKLANALRGQRSGGKRSASGRRSGAITIGRLAAIHDQGLGHNPKREIIVPPDPATLRRMSRIASATLQRMLTGSGGGVR